MIYVVLAVIFVLVLAAWVAGVALLWTTEIVGVRLDDAPDD